MQRPGRLWETPSHLRITGMPGAYGSRKKPLEPLELTLQIIVNCHLGGENRAQDLWKSNQCS
ncbi:mCG147656 [Mus musculus]|nr:mCG147656 [Mus musculus]